MDQGTKRNVLVTGAAGLIGSHLVTALLERGIRVTGLDDLSSGVLQNLQGQLDHPSFNFVEESILNREAMLRLAEGKDTVFHLAALKIPRYSGSLRTLEVNGRGTEIMLEAARANQGRFIFASTDDIYGKNEDLPFSEESSLILGESRINRWSLAASKMYGEHLCYAFHEEHQVPMTIIRYAGGYGPTCQLSNLSGPQDIFINAALKDEPLPIHGNGTQTRTFTYISDTIEGTMLVFDSPHVDGEIINIGSENAISIINLAYLIWRLVGRQNKPKLQFIPYTDFSPLYEDPLHRRCDMSKARHLLGYEPKVGLQEGMTRLVEWQRARSATR